MIKEIYFHYHLKTLESIARFFQILLPIIIINYTNLKFQKLCSIEYFYANKLVILH